MVPNRVRRCPLIVSRRPCCRNQSVVSTPSALTAVRSPAFRWLRPTIHASGDKPSPAEVGAVRSPAFRWLRPAIHAISDKPSPAEAGAVRSPAFRWLRPAIHAISDKPSPAEAGAVRSPAFRWPRPAIHAISDKPSPAEAGAVRSPAFRWLRPTTRASGDKPSPAEVGTAVLRMLQTRSRLKSGLRTWLCRRPVCGEQPRRLHHKAAPALLASQRTCRISAYHVSSSAGTHRRPSAEPATRSRENRACRFASRLRAPPPHPLPGR